MKVLSKVIALTLAVALACSLLAGCGEEGSAADDKSTAAVTSTATSAAAPTVEEFLNEPGPVKMPIAEEPITLKVFIQNQTPLTLTNYNEMEGIQELSKKTGINFEFEHPATGADTQDLNSKLNIYFASGQIPDIIACDLQTIQGGYLNLVQNKQILQVNDLVEKYMPNYRKTLEDNKQYKASYVLDGGVMAAFCQFSSDMRLRSNGGFIIRQDWLKKLNLKTPTTIDEMHDVLKAFKERDPNGNGKADEIPYTEAKRTGPLYEFTAAWGLLQDFYIDDAGKVQYGCIQPNFKEYLKTMAQWYKEGLIDSEFPIQDGKAVEAKQTAEQVGMFFGWQAGGIGKWNATMQAKNPEYQMYPLPHPVAAGINLRNGKPYTCQDMRPAIGPSWSFSANLKYPVEAAKLVDYFFTPEGESYICWGVEGKSYNVVDGKKVFVESLLTDPAGPISALSKYCLPTQGAFPKNVTFENQSPLLLRTPEQKAISEVWVNNDPTLLLPMGTSLTPEEGTLKQAIMTEVDTIRLETTIGIVTGQLPLDAFDAYVAKVKEMGIDKVIKAEQDAVERIALRNK